MLLRNMVDKDIIAASGWRQGTEKRTFNRLRQAKTGLAEVTAPAFI